LVEGTGSNFEMVDRLGELGVSKAVAETDLERGGAAQSQHMHQFFQEVGIVKHKIAAIRRNVNVISQVTETPPPLPSPSFSFHAHMLHSLESML
jgi:3-methyladenine DNA glycosylase Tag